jgi:hypothetical protein
VRVVDLKTSEGTILEASYSRGGYDISDLKILPSLTQIAFIERSSFDR